MCRMESDLVEVEGAAAAVPEDDVTSTVPDPYASNIIMDDTSSTIIEDCKFSRVVFYLLCTFHEHINGVHVC